MEATLVTFPAKTEGKMLYLNAVTRKGGEIRAELLRSCDPEDMHWVPPTPLDGYSKDDCTAFRGDHKCLALQWKGKDARSLKGYVCVRFHMRRARLYGFDWR